MNTKIDSRSSQKRESLREASFFSSAYAHRKEAGISNLELATLSLMVAAVTAVIGSLGKDAFSAYNKLFLNNVREKLETEADFSDLSELRAPSTYRRLTGE